MNGELLAPDSPKWRAFLTDVPHDFYHLPSYVDFWARRENGEARALFVESERGAMLLPLVLRPIDGAAGKLDAGSPYGYPGPLFRRAIAGDASFAADAAQAACAVLRERAIVSLFVRLHPLLNRDLTSLSVGAFVDHGVTVSIDLAQSSEQRWRAIRHGHRSEIRSAEKAGYEVLVDDDWSHADVFTRLYERTMRRVDAAPFYMFDREYFDALREATLSRVVMAVVLKDREVVAGGLFGESSGIVQYHLSGTDEAHAAASPTKLLIHRMAEWGAARGDRVLHLGGGVGASQDSLFRFKAGFSTNRHPFRTWRVIVDGPAYDALRDEGSRGSSGSDPGGFFPAYRHPSRR